MKNLKPQIFDALKSTSADDVVFFYPDKWEKSKKIISYYELDNSEASGADDEEYSSNIAIRVDIWCDTPSECSELAIEVSSKMRKMDFIRTLSLDLHEDGALKHHKTMHGKR